MKQYVDPVKNWQGEPKALDGKVRRPELTAEQIKKVEKRIKNWDKRNF